MREPTLFAATVTSVEYIPEPYALALLALGMMGLGYRKATR